MNKIERKRVKRERAKLNAENNRLTQQLSTALEQLRLARHDRANADEQLEDWRKKLQAIHRHIAVLPPVHNFKYAGPRYAERRLPELQADHEDRPLSVRMLTMAELYLEMRKDVFKWQRYFHFTAIPPIGADRRMAYCVSEEMWHLMQESDAYGNPFENQVLRTMYRNVMQLRT